MRLVFIHGWGFDAQFWEPLSSALSDMPQTRVDFGFFSEQVDIPIFNDDDILIGHSMGFLWGMAREIKWRGWVSINGFARFTDHTTQKACVPPSALRAMRHSLAKNTEQTLANFYKKIGAEPNSKTPNAAHLAVGLEILQNADATVALRDSTTSGLVLASRQDPLVPAAATEFLAAQVKDTGLLWQDQGGHLLPISHTAWCADAIRKYLL